MPGPERGLPQAVYLPEAADTYAAKVSVPEGIPVLDVSAGEAHQAPPQFRMIRRKLTREGAFDKAALHYPEGNGVQAERFLRDRFKISDNPYIVISSGGSDAIIDRLPRVLLAMKPVERRTDKSETHVIGVSPHFPTITNTIKSYENSRLRYRPHIAPFSVTMDENLEMLESKMGQYIQDTHGGAVVIYICWPGTPDGKTGSIERRDRFIEFCEERGVVNIWDEAFGDYLPDSESAIRHTEDKKTPIVLRSPSKALGIPGERIGAAFMHQKVGEAFKRPRLPHDVSTSVQILAGNFLNPEIITPYLENLRKIEEANKRYMLEQATKVGVTYLDTDVRVPITAFDGGTEYYHEELLELGIITASGGGFRGTYPGLDGRIVRVRTPRTKKEIRRLVNGLRDAKSNSLMRARGDAPAEIFGKYTSTVIGLPESSL